MASTRGSVSRKACETASAPQAQCYISSYARHKDKAERNGKHTKVQSLSFRVESVYNMMYLGLAIVAALLGICTVASQNNCPGFKIFDDETELMNFSCTEYDLSDGCWRKEYSYLPASLSEGLSVARPDNFTVGVLRKTVNSSETSAVRYTWSVPASAGRRNRQHIKGYFLRMLQTGSGHDALCKAFDLRNVDLTDIIKLHFSYETRTFDNERSVMYEIEMLSLPPPVAAEYDEMHVQRLLNIPQMSDSAASVEYSAQWTTQRLYIVQYPSEGKVKVEFDYPNHNFSFTFEKYVIRLVDDNYLDQATASHTAGHGSSGSHIFTNVPTGEYRVEIRPERDVDYDRCSFCSYVNMYRSCKVCATSQSAWFNFTRTWTTTMGSSTMDQNVTNEVTVPYRTNESNDSATEESEESSGNLHVVVPLITITVVIVLVTSFGVAYCYWKRRQLKTLNDEPGSQLPKREVRIPHVRRKTILLLAAEDHKSFSQAVEMFAQFLQLHCQCDVMYAPQQLPDLHKSANNYCWLSRQVDDSDFVVIVTSEAAFHLYSAFQKGFSYKEADFGPEGDLFMPGIQHICGKIAVGEDVRKVVMVHFEHTLPSLRLPILAVPTRHYLLPKHLPSFLHLIHGLDKNTMELSQVNLPLQGNVEQLPGGKEWLSAVFEAKAFEIQNPDWFEQRFGESTNTALSLQDWDSGRGDSRIMNSIPNGQSEFLVPSGGSAFFPPSMGPSTSYDGPSNLDVEFGRINKNYEKGLQARHSQEMQHFLQESRSAVSDETSCLHSVQHLSSGQDDEDLRDECVTIYYCAA